MAQTFGPFPVTNLLGTLTSPSANVPAGTTRAYIDFDASTLTDAATRIFTRIEFAPDGTTWRDICTSAIEVQPGKLDRNGLPIQYTLNCDIPQEGATPKVRGTLTVTGAAATTTLTLRTTP